MQNGLAKLLADSISGWARLVPRPFFLQLVKCILLLNSPSLRYFWRTFASLSPEALTGLADTSDGSDYLFLAQSYTPLYQFGSICYLLWQRPH
uniref:Uncharacterized protein n=1 Tax=Caenorhabditis japonica TaxID=281687 RepID=A0A8R1EH47_CAEJA